METNQSKQKEQVNYYIASVLNSTKAQRSSLTNSLPCLVEGKTTSKKEKRKKNETYKINVNQIYTNKRRPQIIDIVYV